MLRITDAVIDSTGLMDVHLDNNVGSEVHVDVSTFRKSRHDALLGELKRLERDIHEFVERGEKDERYPF